MKMSTEEIRKKIESNRKYRKAFAVSNPSEAGFLTGDGKRAKAFYYRQNRRGTNG